MSLIRSRRKGVCQCCGSVDLRWLYRYYAYLYCALCLHSIGITAEGTECSPELYRRAWKELAG